MIESYFPSDQKSKDKDFAIGLFHMKKEEYQLAIPHLISFIEKSGDMDHVIKMSKILSYAYIKLERLKEAFALLSSLSEDYVEDPEIQNMLAYIEYLNGKVNMAFRRYCQILRIHPSNITAINAISYCMVDFFNQPYEALQMLKPYINDDPRILDTIAWSYFKMGKLDEALNYITQAFDRMPTNKEIKEHMAIISEKSSKN